MNTKFMNTKFINTKFINIRLSILATAFATFGCFASIGMAADEFFPDDQALILEEYDRLHIETPVAADLAVMNVRVFSPDNELLLSTRTMGESVEFLVDSRLPDGEYRYETVSIFGNVDLNDRSSDVEGETSLVRKFGSFKVSNGEIAGPDPQVLQHEAAVLDDASLLDRVIKQAVNLAGITLDVLIPSAHAADLIASSGFPNVTFDDTAGAGNNEWRLAGTGNNIGGSFVIFDFIGTNNHVPIQINGSAGSALTAGSIFIGSDGDIHWANASLNFDKGDSALSIGTSAVRRDLTIASGDPATDLFNEMSSDSMGINYSGADFSIYNTAGADSVRINWAAPENSIRVRGSGNVGLGLGSPSASLHVARSNKTAQLKVTDTSGTVGNLNLLQLENTGGAQIGFNDTTRPYQWNFIGGRDFKINATTFAGTEFTVFRNGNATLSGVLTENSDVNAKEKIVPIDRQDVLSRIASLPITEWSYIDTPRERHIGPMAQDFHAAFGLGHDDTLIATLDTAGVALAGIQALLEEYNLLKKENLALLERMESQAVRLEQVEVQQGMLQTVIAALYEDKAARTLASNTISN